MKISLEVIPSHLFGSNLKSLIPYKSWLVISKYCAAESNNQCDACGYQYHKNTIENHEVYEFDTPTRIQRLIGLMALCRNCHLAKHFKYADKKGLLSQIRAHVNRINGWTDAEFAREMDRAHGETALLKQYEWTLDLTYLLKLGLPKSIARRYTPAERKALTLRNQQEFKKKQIKKFQKSSSSRKPRRKS